MRVFVVRHAKAGRRGSFAGPDEGRPLTKSGWRQARGLVDVLGRQPVDRVVSSPSVRCLESVTPLAEHLGLTVEIDDGLAEGAGFEPALELVRGAAAGTVLCTHGDVIESLLAALERRGLVLPTGAGREKGSTWALEVGDGEVTGAVFLPARAR